MRFTDCTMFQELIKQDISKAITELQSTGQWPDFEMPKIIVDMPLQESHGDYATNVAMKLAQHLKKEPIEIANEIKTHLNESYTQVQIVQPGFLNIFVSSEQLARGVEGILKLGHAYGSSSVGNKEKVLIEFISANPTGPLTLPNGRGGYLGDVLSNVYEELGYDVIREYYINDRGHQVDILGESVARRYLQQQGINVPFPEELYQGEYISELAQQLKLKDYKLTNLKKMEWIKDRVKVLALELMLKEIKRVVEEKMQIHFDSWLSEKSLYDDHMPEKMLSKLNESGTIYVEDGATWLRTSQFGDDKDRVLIKSTGEGAYIQGDVSLFYYRAFRRKIDKVILILGADHHGYEKRLKAIPQLLHTETQFDIIFTQMTTLLKDGEEVRMSKRAGHFVTIEELIDEVGNDVTRFFFLMHSSDRHMSFDLDLAKERSEQNPVFYVQYAHARICSVMREVEKVGVPTAGSLNGALEDEAERSLVKKLVVLPQLLEIIAKSYEVHHLTTYAMELARSFHHFYDHCRVIDNATVNVSRYQLLQATKIVLQKTLKIIGVGAPEKM